MPIPITEQPKVLPKVGDPIPGTNLKYEEADIANLGYTAPATTDATIANSTVRRYTRATGRMDYSNPAYPQGIRIAIDPTTGEDIPTSPLGTPTGGAPVTYASEALRIAAEKAKSPLVTDEATIRQQMRERVQEQIDAIKNTYAGLISKENIAGMGRLGETRAIGARSGILGQDFGTAQMEKTTQLNEAQVKALENERDVTIGGILTKIDSEAYTRAQNALATADKNSQEYLTALKANQDTSIADATLLAKSGADLSKLTDEQYKKLLTSSGYTDEQMKALFIVNKPEDKVVTSGTVGNKYYVVTKDPITGAKKSETIDLGFIVPVEWKEQKLDNGSILFYNPKNPKEQQIYNVGTSGGGKGLSATDIKNLNAGGVATDVAQGIFKDASSGYSDTAIQKNLDETYGGELAKQYWTAFTNTMRKSQTANAALLNALGIH